MKIILVDNDDSFTGNLEHLLVASTGSPPTVVPYSYLCDLDLSTSDLAVISAGPGKPCEYPDYASLLESGTPVLGICLGIQIINEHFGGTTGKLPDCVHGKTDIVRMDGRDLVVARYHSLYLKTVADCLEVVGTNREGIPMVLRHRRRNVIGYQFHPESFMTPNGAYFIDYAISLLFKDRTRAVSDYGGGSRAPFRR